MDEPRDGDFVAYIDALQKASAARLLRPSATTADAAPGAVGGVPLRDTSGTSSAPAAPGATPSTRDADARLMKGLVAAVVGIAFLLVGIGEGGPLPFVVGVALLFYAAAQLRRAWRTVVTRPPNRAAIEQVFGRPPSQTPVKKR